MNNSLFIYILIALQSCSAWAGSLTCGGEVETLGYHADNKLMLKLSSMNRPVMFCSPDSVWSVSGTPYKTGPQTCQTLYSTFLALKLSGKPIATMYFDGDDVPGSCTSWSEWSTANIRHYLLN